MCVGLAFTAALNVLNTIGLSLRSPITYETIRLSYRCGLIFLQNSCRHKVDLLVICHVDRGRIVQIDQHIYLGRLFFENHSLSIRFGDARHAGKNSDWPPSRKRCVFVSMVVGTPPCSTYYMQIMGKNQPILRRTFGSPKN